MLPVRLYRNYEMISDLIRFIAYNFRYPKQWYGDFLAQVGSLWVAENRVKELCNRFGYDAESHSRKNRGIARIDH